MALDKWNDYLACDGLPRAEDPAQIRHYILKLSTEEQQAATADINWVLSVNERSILSHAPDRTDMTRRHLEETLRPNIGKLYDDTVQGILETHRRVEQVLRNEIELLEMPSQRALELTKVGTSLYIYNVEYLEIIPGNVSRYPANCTRKLRPSSTSFPTALSALLKPI